MNGEQEGQEFLAGEGTLFAEDASRVEAARVVVQWLEGFKEKEKVKAGPDFQKMADSVLRDLKKGRIFFGIKKRDRQEAGVSIGVVYSKVPVGDNSEGELVLKEITRRVWVVLVVEEGIELDELKGRLGDDVLTKLFKTDEEAVAGRVTVADKIKLSVQKSINIGPFPDWINQKMAAKKAGV